MYTFTEKHMFPCIIPVSAHVWLPLDKGPLNPLFEKHFISAICLWVPTCKSLWVVWVKLQLGGASQGITCTYSTSVTMIMNYLHASEVSTVFVFFLVCFYLEQPTCKPLYHVCSCSITPSANLVWLGFGMVTLGIWTADSAALWEAAVVQLVIPGHALPDTLLVCEGFTSGILKPLTSILHTSRGGQLKRWLSGYLAFPK